MGVKERRAREKSETRDKILDAARDLFVSEGYEGVSMRKVAEKIALAHGEFAETGPRPLFHRRQNPTQDDLKVGPVSVVAGRIGSRGQCLAKASQLLQVLLQAEVPRKRAKKRLLHADQRGIAFECLLGQGEARPDKGLFAGYLASNVIIAAAVGDPAPEHVALLVEDHRLGGGGSEIDAHVNFHDCYAFVLAERFCSSIWR